MELDAFSVQIELENEAIPLGPAVTLDYVHMSCSTQIGVPMLNMVLLDSAGWLTSKFLLFDGAVIRIKTTNNGSSEMRQFRLSSFRQENVGSGIKYSIDGYLDVPLYWLGSTTTPLVGTSEFALKQIAQTCNLRFRGVSTNDSRAWTPRNMPYHEWARMIAEEGYRSDSACMQLGLDMDEGLIYEDIEGNASNSFSFVLGSYGRGSNVFAATSHRPISKSGVLNAFSGYNESFIEQNPYSESTFKVHDRVQINKPKEGSMQVNADLHSKVKQGRVTFSSINPGNVSSVALRAKYQNRRVTNLYSSGLEVLTPQATKIRLMDQGLVIADLSEAPHTKQFVGTYRVVSRVVFIKNLQRFEKFVLARKSINEKVPTNDSTYAGGGAPLFTEEQF